MPTIFLRSFSFKKPLRCIGRCLQIGSLPDDLVNRSLRGGDMLGFLPGYLKIELELRSSSRAPTLLPPIPKRLPRHAHQIGGFRNPGALPNRIDYLITPGPCEL